MDESSDGPRSAPSGRRAVSAERIEASHALARAWERAVVDLAFEAAGRAVRIDTERADIASDDGRRGDGRRGGSEIELATVHGTVGEGTFAVELPVPLLAGLVAGLPDAPEPLALAPADAALVLEHALTAGIEAAEADLEEAIRVESVEEGPLVSELQPFVMAVWADKRRHLARAVVGDPLHMRILAEWLGDRAMTDEYDAGPATRVEIGPIVLAPEDWAAIEPGDALAIGTEPGANLKGRLVRPTGRTLPVEIDTSHVIAAGALEDHAPEPPAGELHLGVAIGTVRLTPTHLARAESGARFIMERNADNACELMNGETVLARGALTLIDGQLGVEVHALGDARAPADPPGPAPEPRPIAGVVARDDADTDADADADEDVEADDVARVAPLRRAS